jgi:Tfp pilus assembly protein PilV
LAQQALSNASKIKMRYKAKRKLKNGITLTEVLIASLLLISATVPILKALTSAQTASTNIERKTNSLILARAQIEAIRTRAVYSYSNSYSADSINLGASYLCNIIDMEVNSNLRQITVSVGYDENGSRTLSGDEIRITLNTLIARRT